MAKISFTPVVGDARGKAGRSVFSATRSGPIIRLRVVPLNPRSAAQTSIRSYLAAASRQFKALSSSELSNWTNYAATVTKHNPVTGQAYHPAPINIFNELAVKYMQVNGGGVAPETIPAAPFSGDGKTVTAAGGSGKVTFTASAANDANVKIEMLYKKLASANVKTPSVGYKSGGFYAATVGTLTNDLTLDPGEYAVAYREVLDTTGQMTPIIILGKETVS